MFPFRLGVQNFEGLEHISWFTVEMWTRTNYTEVDASRGDISVSQKTAKCKDFHAKALTGLDRESAHPLQLHGVK